MIAKLLCSVAVLSLVSCGGSSGGGGKKKSPGTTRSNDPLSPVNEVAYQSDCSTDREVDEDGEVIYLSYSKKILKLRENSAGEPSVAYHQIQFSDEDCSTAMMDIKIIVKGNFNNVYTEFTGAPVAATFKPLMVEMAEEFNEQKACGQTGWAVDVEKSVFGTNCIEIADTVSAEFKLPYDESQEVIELTLCQGTSSSRTASAECYSSQFVKI